MQIDLVCPVCNVSCPEILDLKNHLADKHELAIETLAIQQQVTCKGRSDVTLSKDKIVKTKRTPRVRMM